MNQFVCLRFSAKNCRLGCNLIDSFLQIAAEMKAGSARSSFLCLQLPEYPADNQPAQHKCTEISDGLGISMLEVMRTADEYAPLSKKSKPLMAFAEMMDSLSELAEQNDLDILFDEVLSRTGYMQMLESQLPESQPRIENVREPFGIPGGSGALHRPGQLR